MRLILNEMKQAEKMIKEKRLGEDKNESIKILIKYYKHKEIGSDKTRNEIEDFLSSTTSDFNSVKMGDYLDGLVNSCYKNNWTLLQREDIIITKKEIESIRKLNDRNLEKLCFVMLIMCKADNIEESKYGFWVNRDITEIFNESNIKRNSVLQDAMLRKLRESKYMDLSSNVRKMGLKLNYVDKIKDYSGEEISIKLNKFEQLDLVYLKLIGERIIECEECGKLIQQINNKIKYCKKCSVYKNIEKTKRNKEKQIII